MDYNEWKRRSDEISRVLGVWIRGVLWFIAFVMVMVLIGYLFGFWIPGKGFTFL